jgi:hypothetical protein
MKQKVSIAANIIHNVKQAWILFVYKIIQASATYDAGCGDP